MATRIGKIARKLPTPEPEEARPNESAAEPITAVLRASKLLEVLADTDTGLTFAEIVALLDVNKGIALKIVNSLLVTRYIYRDDESGVFRLTFKLSNLGMRKIAGAGLLRQTSPILRQYAEETGELVRLAVVEGDLITWIMSFPAKQRLLQINPDYPFEIRLHQHAAGKAWLATLPDERALALAQAAGLDPATPHSLSKPEALMKDLQAIRKRGYSLNYEENSLGVGAIGAPIVVRSLSSQQECVGVVTLSAPCARMNKTQLHASAPRLMDIAKELSEVWPLALDARRE
jgi:IclR family acetate operon transcriptional repressor